MFNSTKLLKFRKPINFLPKLNNNKIINANYNRLILPISSIYNNNKLNSNNNIDNINNNGLLTKSRNYVIRRTTAHPNPTLGDILKEENINLLRKEYDDYFNLLKNNIAMKVYLKNVYLSSTLGFTGTLITGLIFSQLVPLTLAPTLIGAAGSILSILYFNSKQPRYETVEMIWEDKDRKKTGNSFIDNEVVVVENKSKTIVPVKIPHYSTSQRASFLSLSISNGLMISTALSLVPMGTVLNVALMSVAVTAGSVYCALRMRPDDKFLNTYRPIMYGGLAGLLGIGLLGIGSSLIFGPNAFSQVASSIDLYAGIILFTGLTAVDTHNGLKLFKEGRPDYLRVSIDIMLNTLNIFIRLLRFNSNDDNSHR